MKHDQRTLSVRGRQITSTIIKTTKKIVLKIKIYTGKNCNYFNTLEPND